MGIEQDLTKHSLDALIELVTIDGSEFGAGSWNFTPNITEGGVFFGGVEFIPLPFKSNGWGTSIGSAPEQPTISFSNVTKLLQPYLTASNDGIGCKVFRRFTLAKYLDGAPMADDSQTFNESTFIIERLSKHTKVEIEFVLSSLLDQPNTKLPKRQVLRAIFPGCGLSRR